MEVIRREDRGRPPVRPSPHHLITSSVRAAGKQVRQPQYGRARVGDGAAAPGHTPVCAPLIRGERNLHAGGGEGDHQVLARLGVHVGRGAVDGGGGQDAHLSRLRHQGDRGGVVEGGSCASDRPPTAGGEPSAPALRSRSFAISQWLPGRHIIGARRSLTSVIQRK